MVRRGSARLWIALGIAVALGPGRAARAGPVAEAVEFDVDGDGSMDDALRLAYVETEWAGGFLLSQSVGLEPDRSYCVSLKFATHNVAAEISGRYRLTIDLGPRQWTTLTPLIDPGVVYRDSLVVVVQTDAGFTPGAGELHIRVDHDRGPAGDPTLYLDQIRVQPFLGRWLTDEFVQETWISDSTILGWRHDFRSQGAGPASHVGAAFLELVLWDDDELDPLEYVDVDLNGIFLARLEPDGNVNAPDVVRLELRALECTHGFAGILDFRLRSVGTVTTAPGDLVFGAARAFVEVGDPGPSLLRNGDFGDGVRGWMCDGRPCGPVAAQPTTWSRLKEQYR